MFGGLEHRCSFGSSVGFLKPIKYLRNQFSLSSDASQSKAAAKVFHGKLVQLETN